MTVLLLALAMVVPGTIVQADERSKQLAFGVEMARRGLWAEALFRFERAAKENPGNPKIMNNLAVAHEAVGEFDEALELYRQAVELDPANADLKRNYARFVEFYQSFRPRDESKESASEEREESAASEGAASEGQESG